jgi:hypothetical protein
MEVIVMQQHLLAGEDPATLDVGEIRHWIRVYTQAWKTARRAGLLAAAHRFRRRLEYWTARLAELAPPPAELRAMRGSA